MRICIEESTYEGTPIEILTQLRALHFDAGTFDGTEGYIRYMQNTIRRSLAGSALLGRSFCEDHRPEFSGWRYRSWLASFRCGGLVCTFFGYGSMPPALRQFLKAYLRQPTGRPFCS